MELCLEGPKGWDWFDFEIGEPTEEWLARVEEITGSNNPYITDTSYTENYEGLFDIDGYGYTTLLQVVKQCELLSGLYPYEIEEIAAYKRVWGGDLEDAIDSHGNHIYIQADSGQDDLARAYIELCGDVSDELLAQYFDYYALGEGVSNEGYESDYEDDEFWEIGEDYVDQVYGSVENYIQSTDRDVILDYYFDYDSYGRDLYHGFSYDEVSGVWISESAQRLKTAEPLVEKLILRRDND